MAATVLVVEDDSFLTRAYQTKLEGASYTVLYAQDGVEALQILNKQTVDCVLLDLVLPKKGGIEFLKELRATDRFKQLPVIIATNLSSPQEKKQCDELGALHCYIKSDVSIDQIISSVEQVLQK